MTLLLANGDNVTSFLMFMSGVTQTQNQISTLNTMAYDTFKKLGTAIAN